MTSKYVLDINQTPHDVQVKTTWRLMLAMFNWTETNCRGKFSHRTITSETKLQWRPGMDGAWFFEKKEDAAHFKLVWHSVEEKDLAE